VSQSERFDNENDAVYCGSVAVLFVFLILRKVKFDMKIFVLLFFALVMTSRTIAGPEAKPATAVCKAELKEWSAQKTETLTIDQILERMHTMVACADEAHHHRHSQKKTFAYLNEFYRVHTELANRTFDFITRHNLKTQFDEEENAGGGQTASKETDNN
jgi:hypothetical protein